MNKDNKSFLFTSIILKYFLKLDYNERIVSMGSNCIGDFYFHKDTVVYSVKRKTTLSGL